MKRRGIRSPRAAWAGVGLIGGWALAASAVAQMQPVALQPISLKPPIQLRAMIDDGAAMTPTPSGPVIRLPAVAGWSSPGRGLDPQTCLTQAVYYEARSESRQGQEAVAQVVMNRTRLSQYPDSVCEVVYEGADAGIGCQFTFACDGSLDNPGYGASWDEAEDVARKALAGYVCKPVALATHYHAFYVSPYWRTQLTRIGRIGAHIFYR